MDIKQLLAYVGALIVSAGGVGGIIIAVISFSSNIISERLAAKYEAKLEHTLEKYKTELTKKSYVSKIRFHEEFRIYKDLSKEFSLAVKHISIMIPVGYTTVPSNEEDRKKQEEKNFFDANNAVVSAQDTLYANGAFISKDLYEKYNEILKLCGMQLSAFTKRYIVSYMAPKSEKECFKDEDYERTSDINSKWNSLNDEVRIYLSNLEVLD